MRKATIRLEAEREWFGQLDNLLTDQPDITREAIHNVRLLEDESLLTLYEYRGDRELFENVLAEYETPFRLGPHAEVIGWELSERRESLFLYQHHRPHSGITKQFELLDEHRLLIEPPVGFTEDGNFRVDLIGPEDAFREAYDAGSEWMSLGLDRIGDYGPDADVLLNELTDGEREVLATAVELGYFENPRGANYDDIADAVGCSKATVGHHIRNAEAKLMQLLVPDRSEQMRRLQTA
jgi:predicted DNA binding protein